MFKANGNYSLLQGSFLFSEISRRTNAYQAAHPEANVIRMGIGDVTRPLVPAVIEALHRASDDMAHAETFHGYGPEQGYAFLREAIARVDYNERGIDVKPDEIFVSDGAKCDVGNIQELFGRDTTVAVMDPVYPVYVDTNVMAGRSGKYNAALGGYENMVYLPCTAENGFMPALPDREVDVIYLCYPNNPTGMTLTRDQLKVFVDYANKTGALLLYDSAYESYIREPGVPRSVYEIPGAETCAIEFRSMSKTAGFTGTRCAYTVVPHALKRKDDFGNEVSLNQMWNRRHCTKFNGVSYITQRAAEAIFTPEGRIQIAAEVDYYMENARIIRESLKSAGYTVFGGVNAPYIWLQCGKDSWDFFDELLNEKQIVGTPGVGFGAAGAGYFRMTAFATRENTLAAMDRICK
ncbi:MAG: LL-diaminopimelate aminotransferase [Clostridia bacterium]|nr:LL-diaminopimelate aminotransferase [Clostridia bacterium]MBR0025822.1 LL-diaminopimelate aminotransferase [Clostridia bacterium]